MFARVTTLQGTPEKIEEAIRNFREQALPAGRNMKGFQGGYFLVDRKTGKGMSVALWDTENDMRASEEAADRLRAQIASAAGAQIVSVERYEVAVAPEHIPTGARG